MTCLFQNSRTASRERSSTPSLVNQSQQPLERNWAQSLKMYFKNVRSVFFTEYYLCSNNNKIIIKQLLVQKITLEEEGKTAPTDEWGKVNML